MQAEQYSWWCLLRINANEAPFAVNPAAKYGMSLSNKCYQENLGNLLVTSCPAGWSLLYPSGTAVRYHGCA